ncbi:hypothetical protein D9M71_638580 [compost metagenome]
MYRTHRHGGLVDDYFGTVSVFEDAVDHGENVFQVGATIGLRRSTDGNELQPGIVGSDCGIRGEAQPTAGEVLLQQRRKAGLEDRAMAFTQAGHPIGIDIHAQHRMAHLGQAHRLGQADIAGSENRDLHLTAP